MRHCALVIGVLWSLSLCPASSAQTPLPSWNDGPARQAILRFVQEVSSAGLAYVAPAERIAVFDNDGTLWNEQPMYIQLAFALDRVQALSPSHPEWKTSEPFKSALARDFKGLAATGEKGMLELVMATHAGMTSDEFRQIVMDWLGKARHPKFGRPYAECVYAPMLELLAYLRANGFKTYIVSGGGIEFVRAFAEKVYGIPPEQVVGSTVKTQYESRGGKPAILRLPALDFLDDKAGKPVAIDKFIGRRPIAAFGNSDGDFEMLEWTTSATGKRLGLIVHHDDGQREYAYDRQSAFGRLARGLDESARRGWIVVSMKRDWRTVFPAR
jgi:phosphoserine phosphatase